MLHLELSAVSGPEVSVITDLPLSLPAGMDLAEIDCERQSRIPLLAYGDVHEPITMVAVSRSGQGILRAFGWIEGPGAARVRPLWDALAEGRANASLSLRDGRSQGRGLELWAISLELVNP